ncbi:MAG: hypothetical protein U5K53_10675 [Halanaerobiales bacterium]|nr:hypothetical protein [Halanaerobiales bacterium]
MIDVIITTNSPGEVSAWVRPVVDELNKKDIEKNIYVFTPPCVFSSGNEGKVLNNIEGVTNTFNKKEYLKYVLFNIRPLGFNPSKKGFVLFLGGDFMHAVFLGKKLGYPVYSYTERDFGFKRSVKKFYLSDENIYKKLIDNGILSSKLKVVGNLMYDSINPKLSKKETKRLLDKKDNDFIINLMPGSRSDEFRFALPLFLEVAEKLFKQNNQLKFIISKSSFVDESIIKKTLKDIDDKYNISYDKNNKSIYINNIKINIYEKNIHSIMRESDFAITIPGTNNLELAVLRTPMLVLLPLNRPELIPLPGLIGLIGEIPFLGKIIKKLVIPNMAKKRKYISLVNLIYNENIVPELMGVLDSNNIANTVIKLLETNETEEIKKRINKLQFDNGAAEIMVDDILNELNTT